MNGWAEIGAWRERREELLREVGERRLARVLREGRGTRTRGGRSGGPSGGRVVVRWGLAEDEAGVAKLLELNGLPHPLAFEDRFVVAEEDGEVLAALRYRPEPERLLLGLLVADPWAGERRLAVALYAGAGRLARELGAGEVLARPVRGADYPREAGYRRWGRGWRLDGESSVRGRDGMPAPPARGRLGPLGAFFVPFFRAFRGPAG